jgi:hypothetical protein
MDLAIFAVVLPLLAHVLLSDQLAAVANASSLFKAWERGRLTMTPS